MKFQFSAGGIVYKKTHSTNSGQEELFILVCQHSQHHGWVFPKGLIGDHIKNEEKEETGVLGKIIKPLNPIEYWYVFENEKIKKTVYYFLMTVVSENIAIHDKEMENVEWLEAEKVETRLTYPADKKVWQETRQLIADGV